MITKKFIDKNKNKIAVQWMKFVPLPGCDLYDNSDPFNVPMTTARLERDMINAKLKLHYL